MILFFGFVGFACSLGATVGFLSLRRWGLGAALFGMLLGTAAGGLLFPFPIHGGVTFLGEVLWEEVADWVHGRAERRAERRDEVFRRSLERRFAGDLEFTLDGRRQGVWVEAELEDGTFAWYDSESGMVWRDPRTAGSWDTDAGLARGRRFCAELSPPGYWALPTEGELFGFWDHKGHLVSPWTGESTLSVLVDEGLRLEIPVWYRGSGSTVSLRCVARGPRAPKAGYFQSDVDPTRWNQYQLVKAKTLRGPGREHQQSTGQ